MSTKTEKVLLAASKYTSFDPKHPELTDIHNFRMFSEGSTFEDGSFFPVGTAEITATLFDRETMTVNAIELLERERRELQIEAAKKVADLDDQIKRLQAITYQPESQDVS